MFNNVRHSLQFTREQLLKQYMLTKGPERAEILARIMELDEQIEEEKKLYT